MAHAAPHFINEYGSVGDAPDGNIFSPFFGTPGGYHAEVRADDQLSHETYNLPKAYEGKNKRIEDVLDFLIRKEDEFYTRDLMPWEFTLDLHIVWDVWKFNRTLASIVPEQGISRLVTQESERHTDNLIRRGLGFQLEHGFMTTEAGRRNYSMNLQQISDAVHVTSYFGVMHALFAGHNYYKEYRRKFARYVKSPRTLFRHERQMWACLQKDVKGLYVMDAECKHFMKTQGVTPDVLVLPPKAGIYVSMVPPSETTYSERGAGAHEALTDGRTGIATFRGCKVFEAQAFDVDFRHEFVDLTGRPRMIGEYFVIPGVEGPRDMQNIIANGVRHLRDITKGAVPARVPYIQNIPAVAVGAHAAAAAAANPLQDLAAGLGHHTDPYIHIYSADVDNWVKICYEEANAHAFNGGAEREQIGRMFDEIQGYLHSLVNRFNAEAERRVGLKNTPRAKKDIAAQFTGHADATPIINILNGVAAVAAVVGVAAGPGVPAVPAVPAVAAINALDADGAGRAAFARPQLALVQQLRVLMAGAAAETVTIVNRLVEIAGKLSDDDTNLALFESTDLDFAAPFPGAVPPAAVPAAAVVNTMCAQLGKMNELLHYLKYVFDADADVHKYDIILFRPFATYTMHSAILAKGGRDLGSVFHGHHDFQLSDNVATKTHFGNYTFYSKPVVKTPRNYTIIPDCFAQGYIAGEGHEFFRPGLSTGAGANDYRDGDLEEAITSGSLGSPECKRSLIAWRVPRGEGKRLREAIDIMGRFPGQLRDFEAADEPHFPGAGALASMERIDELDQNRNDDHYLHQVQHVNTVCFRGAQWTNGIFSDRNRGHWGEAVYPGVLPVRDGALAHMDPSRAPKIGDRMVEFD